MLNIIDTFNLCLSLEAHGHNNDITGFVSTGVKGCRYKGNARIEKYFWSSACSTESSRMDRKHGKYVVNIEHSENPAMKENYYNNWSLWKVFLACLLACVITTAIGILIISLMNNRGNYKSSIVFQLSPKSGSL
ncbi:dynactin-associated protein-like [Pseudorca crassidens]|uniref:dynactin-associated protein-like n=1 Tax=Pseudorca crassidens TaxID=82174 RepID=UPI00352D6AB1